MKIFMFFLAGIFTSFAHQASASVSCDIYENYNPAVSDSPTRQVVSDDPLVKGMIEIPEGKNYAIRYETAFISWFSSDRLSPHDQMRPMRPAFMRIYSKKAKWTASEWERIQRSNPSAFKVNEKSAAGTEEGNTIDLYDPKLNLRVSCRGI